MSFLIPYAIKGGIALGSSLLGSKLSGGAGGVKDPNKLLEEQQANIAAARNLATSLGPQAQNLLGMATQSYSPVANYFGNILSGNRSRMASILAPEASRIAEGYQQAGRTSAALNPRGGPSAAFLAEQPYRQQRDISSLFQTIRPQAASGLMDVGGRAGSLATGSYGNILNALGQVTHGGQGLLDYDLRSRAAQYEKGKDIGASLFGILKDLPIFGGGDGMKPGKTPLSGDVLTGLRSVY